MYAVAQEFAKSRTQLDGEYAKLTQKQQELAAANAPSAPNAPITVQSTPVGQVPVAVPVVQAPQTMAVQVPGNASPGQQIAVVLPNGQTIQALVPQGAKPGSTFHIQI